jgi:hypothetical protein
MGWRDRQKSLLLPVAGEIFLLTLPFIERRYRRSKALLQVFGKASYQVSLPFRVKKSLCSPRMGVARDLTTYWANKSRKAAPGAPVLSFAIFGTGQFNEHR